MELSDASDIVYQTFLFLQIFIQVLLLIYLFDYLEKNHGSAKKKPILTTKTVSIIVPCYNEEKTVKKTIRSLLALDYPKKMVKIVVVDDGSTDGTWKALQEFKNEENVVLLQKTNQGSKYHALNFALEHVDSEFVGCLDADSRVDSQALKNSIKHFNEDAIMAVVPTLTIDQPRSFLQYLQKVEYEIGNAMRSAISAMDALYIAPGPFSLFRKSVFDRFGGYSYAHHTEDLEIALRIQSAGYRIGYSSDSFVYTVGPATFNALLKQRVRWLTGFLRNMIDYRRLLFSPKYGNLGMIVLPYSIFSIVSFLYLAPNTIVRLASWISGIQYRVLGFSLDDITVGWMYIDRSSPIIITLSMLAIVGIFLYIGRKTVNRRFISWDIAILAIYPAIAAVWALKSIYDVVFSRDVPWR